MSNMYQEWDSLSVKIQSLLDVSSFLYLTFQTNSADAGGAMKHIRENANNYVELIAKFKDDFSGWLVMLEKLWKSCPPGIRYE